MSQTETQDPQSSSRASLTLWQKLRLVLLFLSVSLGTVLTTLFIENGGIHRLEARWSGSRQAQKFPPVVLLSERQIFSNLAKTTSNTDPQQVRRESRIALHAIHAAVKIYNLHGSIVLISRQNAYVPKVDDITPEVLHAIHSQLSR